MNMFKEIADIKTSDQLNLPVPEAEYETVVLKPTEQQKEIVASLGERAEVVRNGGVDASVDNMLKITNDGRKLALDQRLVNELLPDDPGSKVSVCAEKSYEIWKDTVVQKSAQIIFCDLSTPKGDGSFNVYDDLKQKLMAKGVPEKEIAFIHDANTEAKKTELFGKVKSGQVRFLIGSTAKMGAGTNVQDRLIALHHLDIGWKPSDLEQREGRIIRQGNHNKKVYIFRYVTESTFAASDRCFARHNLGDELLFIFDQLPHVAVEGGFCHIPKDINLFIVISLPDDTSFPLLQIRRFPANIQMMQSNQTILHVGTGTHLCC